MPASLKCSKVLLTLFPKQSASDKGNKLLPRTHTRVTALAGWPSTPRSLIKEGSIGAPANFLESWLGSLGMDSRKVHVNGEDSSEEISEVMQDLLQEFSYLKESARLERNKNSDSDSKRQSSYPSSHVLIYLYYSGNLVSEGWWGVFYLSSHEYEV